MALRVEVAQNGNRVAAKVSGFIDEQAQVQQELGRINKDATLDLSDVARVNSVGLLSWIRAMKTLTSTHQIEVERISYPLAIQANQLADLFGNALVRSCLAPYFCASCQNNQQVEVTAEEVRAVASGVPEKKCSRCASAMEFDDLDDYFRFLKR